MRLRSVVLPVALAVASALAVPSSASAAPDCNLAMPTKVVLDAETVEKDMTLSDGCFTNQADHAYWNLVHVASQTSAPIEFTADLLADENPNYIIEFYDVDPKGKYSLVPVEAKTAGGADLAQNSATTVVKYGSKLTATVARSGARITWTATATQWSGRSHKYVVRPHVPVALFHQAPGSTTWTYVKAVQASSKGKATVTLGAAKAGKYRLKVGETQSVWASYSSAVKGRI